MSLLIDFRLLGRRLAHPSKDVCGLSVIGPCLLIEGGDLLRRLWFKAVQPVEDIHERAQSCRLGGLRRSAEIRPLSLHLWVIHKLKILPLERDGIVEEEAWSISKNVGDSLLREVPVERARDIGEHEGYVIDQSIGEGGG